MTVTSASLDVAFARAQFPAFDDPDLAAWVYAENAGGSYTAGPVIRRLTDYYTRTKLQGGYPNPVSQRAADAQAEGPARLAPWLGVDVADLHVGPSTTQNTYVLATAFGQRLGAGDAVIVTDQDHESNTGPWRRLAERGVEVREWKVDPQTGSLRVEALEALLDGAVRVVAFPHASNILGEINPVADWCSVIRAAGARSVVDGVAFVPHGLPDVPWLGADAYLFSTYKTYGPHQGVMVARQDLVEELPNQGHFFNEGYRTKRLVPAGPDHAQVAVLAGIADYLDALASHHGDPAAPSADPGAELRRMWRAHEIDLVAPLLAYLEDRSDVRVLGPTDPSTRVPTVSLVHERPAAELAAALAEHHVMAGAGHFYAYRLLQAMGVDPDHGCLRLSLVHLNTPDEVARITAALDAILV